MTKEPPGSSFTEQPGRLAVGSQLQQEVVKQRSHAAHYALAAGALLFCCIFLALGTWQVARLRWKLDLIDRVNHRVHATAVAAPTASMWQQVTAATDEYRHVSVSGRDLYDHAAWVQAATALGSGYWLLVPLRQADQSIVLINRGFVPSRGNLGDADSAPSSDTPITVTGLLRITEPKGGFLRLNDPANGRWYSRDTLAIAQAQGLQQVAPFFIDQDAAPVTAKQATEDQPHYPVGGLTVITFHNSHLVYALTWYALAVMMAGGIWLIMRDRPGATIQGGSPD